MELFHGSPPEIVYYCIFRDGRYQEGHAASDPDIDVFDVRHLEERNSTFQLTSYDRDARYQGDHAASQTQIPMYFTMTLVPVQKLCVNIYVYIYMCTFLIRFLLQVVYTTGVSFSIGEAAPHHIL